LFSFKGYFDQHLVAHSDVNVVGVERKPDFVQGANARQSADGRIVNVSYTIREDSEQELISLARAAHPSPGGHLALVSLHSCGDLTPSMLRIFAANGCRDLRALVAFSCCYHSMEQEESGRRFSNFPMSECLRKVVTATGFDLSVYGMRLACQQDMSALVGKSETEHALHVRQVAYRAILQKFCADRGLSIKKLKRKLAGNQEFSSFGTYAAFVSDRISFQGT